MATKTTPRHGHYISEENTGAVVEIVRQLRQYRFDCFRSFKVSSILRFDQDTFDAFYTKLINSRFGAGMVRSMQLAAVEIAKPDSKLNCLEDLVDAGYVVAPVRLSLLAYMSDRPAVHIVYMQRVIADAALQIYHLVDDAVESRLRFQHDVDGNHSSAIYSACLSFVDLVLYEQESIGYLTSTIRDYSRNQRRADECAGNWSKIEFSGCEPGKATDIDVCDYAAAKSTLNNESLSSISLKRNISADVSAANELRSFELMQTLHGLLQPKADANLLHETKDRMLFALLADVPEPGALRKNTSYSDHLADIAEHVSTCGISAPMRRVLTKHKSSRKLLKELLLPCVH